MSSRRRAKRRDEDRQDVDSVEEVFAEPAGLRFGGEIAVGRGDDPDVDLHVLRIAEPADGLFLKRAEELHLETERKLSDFVQEQSAAIGLFEEPATIECASVNAPFLWPKSSLSRRFSGMAPQLIGTKG